MPAPPAFRSSCPSVVLRLRADGDGDGYADIWRSEADAFASIANYLQQAGWKRGVPWAVPARVPRDAQPRGDPQPDQPAALPGGVPPPQPLADRRRMARAGRRLDRPGLPDTELAALMETDGRLCARPICITTNYRAILDYNCSNFYAMSIGLLADAIARG